MDVRFFFCVHSDFFICLKKKNHYLDGAARIGASLSGELLNAVFANIGQRAIRKVARETFEHLLNLDLKFHLERQTGGLTRAIDRGTKYTFFSISDPSLRSADFSKNVILKRYHVPSTIYHIPHCTHRFGDFDGVRYFSTFFCSDSSVVK